MASKYPNEYDTFRRVKGRDLTIGEPGDIILPDDHNDTADAIEKIERTLGTNPQGSYNSVKERIENIEATKNKATTDFDLDNHNLINAKKIYVKENIDRNPIEITGDHFAQNDEYKVGTLQLNPYLKIEEYKEAEIADYIKTYLRGQEIYRIENGIHKIIQPIQFTQNIETQGITLNGILKSNILQANKVVITDGEKNLTSGSINHGWYRTILQQDVSVQQTETEITQLTIQITNTQYGLYLIIFTAGAMRSSTSTDVNITFRIYRDTTLIRGWRLACPDTNKAYCTTAITLDNRPPGTYTYKIKFFKETDGTAYISPVQYPLYHFAEFIIIDIYHVLGG
jgi:hypothetical protein